MKKVEIEVYNYDELTEDIRLKLLEDEMKAQREFYIDTYLADDLKEKALSFIREEFIHYRLKSEDIKVWYDLSYSQGSGAMVEFELITKQYDTIKIKQKGNYYHQYSFEIDTYLDLSEDEENDLKEHIVRINNKLTNYGYNLIEREWDKEEALLYLREQEYYKNGRFFDD
jgi:hypothetical protein